VVIGLGSYRLPLSVAQSLDHPEATAELSAFIRDHLILKQGGSSRPECPDQQASEAVPGFRGPRGLSGQNRGRLDGSKSQLSHVDLSTSLFKTDLIHQLIDEENTTALSCVDVLTYCGVWKTGWIEALTRIAHDDKHSPRLIAPDT
jgi:hypothetical protein